MTDYFGELPLDDRSVMAELAWKYLRLPSIPDRRTALEVLAWQRLDTEVTEAHAAWLEKAKSTVERSGREWNLENLRYCLLLEDE